MQLLITLAVFCLLGQTLGVASTTALTADVGTAPTANLCTSVAEGSIADCSTTDETVGASQKCCKLTFGTVPTYNEVAIIKGATGGGAAHKIFCYKKGGQFIFLEKTASTKKGAIAGDQFCTTTSAVTTTGDYVETGAMGATATTSAPFVGTAASCTCTIGGDLGTEPTSNDCTGLTNAASPFSTCTSKDDGSGSQKCCLVTFNAKPKFDANDVKVAAKGSQSDAKAFCYKKGGQFIFIDNADKKASINGDQFCKTTVSVTAKLQYLEDGTGTTKDFVGTATSCSCSFSNDTKIYDIGFSLLAILALFWK